MAGIRVIDRDGISVLHPVLWADPEEVPVVFLVVKDGATALAHPDYVSGLLYDISLGDLALDDAWDFLLVKAENMPFPEVCRVKMLPGTEDGAEILVGSQVVYRFS